MRDPNIIKNASVCEGELNGTAQTQAEFDAETHQRCRFFPHACPVTNGGPHCIPRAAAEIARYTISGHTTVAQEAAEFREKYPFPSQGFFDPTVDDQADAITDRDQIMERMSTWANRILGVQPVDAGTYNKEFHGAPVQWRLDAYPVLQKSVFDGTRSIWVHECGGIVVSVDVIHQLRYRAMPLAGDGRVEHEEVPYCPSCETEPPAEGAIHYIEDAEEREAEILRRMRGL